MHLGEHRLATRGAGLCSTFWADQGVEVIPGHFHYDDISITYYVQNVNVFVQGGRH